jgi:hypothetical protein
MGKSNHWLDPCAWGLWVAAGVMLLIEEVFMDKSGCHLGKAADASLQINRCSESVVQDSLKSNS